MKIISKVSTLLLLMVTLTSISWAALPHIKISADIPQTNDVLLSLGAASKKSLPRRLNILVWNLHKGSNDTFATDFDQLGYKKDLILGEEMLLNNSYETATSFFIGKEKNRTGVLTGSSVASSSVDFLRTEVLEPVLNSPKVTLITRYPIRFSTKQLTIVNIHGINFVDNDSYRKEIERLTEVLKKFSGPMIFAGDFNSWNDERYDILKIMSITLDLREAAFFPDNRLTFNKHPLDHFYYSKDIKLISAKVEDFYQGSDHKPLEVVVEYSPHGINLIKP